MDRICGGITISFLKLSIITFLCFVVFDIVYIQMRPYSKSEPETFLNRPINNIRKSEFECVGYGRKDTQEKNQECKKRLPDCIIIGTPKSGTYALLKFLSAHPQVVRNENINEYHFFSLHYEEGLDWYKERMPYSLPGQITLEKSPSYFRTAEAPERIFRMNPNIRLLLIVRHPIHRAVSAYIMNKKRREKERKLAQRKKSSNYETQTVGSFETRWKHHIDFYDTNFEEWLKFFRKEQIHIVDGDAMIEKPMDELSKVEKFLNIDPYFDNDVFVFNATKGFYCLRTSQTEEDLESEMDCLYEGKGNTHPNISESVLNEMKELFRPHNERFYELSGRRFDWDYSFMNT